MVKGKHNLFVGSVLCDQVFPPFQIWRVALVLFDESCEVVVPIK
jgi:hypothetical protein